MTQQPWFLIQARTGSTRLPRKSVLPFFNGKSIFEIIVDNLSRPFPERNIVLATTNDPSDDELVVLAEKAGVKVFRGSVENVLQRFLHAADQFGCQTIVRICADNPFLMPQLIIPLLQSYFLSPCDYISFALPNGIPVPRSHWGLFGEITNRAALKRVAALTVDHQHLEHVTIYLYSNPGEFDVRLLPLPSVFDGRDGYRFTVDQEEDFQVLQDLYRILNERYDISTFSPEQIFEYLDYNGSDILHVMHKQIERNAK
jgi:spore coat polysaccharide biosynthesis protein SpsF